MKWSLWNARLRQSAFHVYAASCVIWVCACGGAHKSNTRGSAGAAGSVEGGAGGASGGSGVDGASHGAGAGGQPPAETLGISVDVLEQRGPAGALFRSVGTHVRAERGDTIVEVTTDDAGRAVLPVDPALGEWDLTIARAGFIPISIIGVTGAVDKPVELWSLERFTPAAPTEAIMSGTVSGTSADSSGLQLQPGGLLFWERGQPSYTFPVLGSSGVQTLRLLVTEHSDRTIDDPKGPLLNAVWLDVPWTGSNLSANISFPSPPRLRTKSSVVLEMPATGAVNADDLEPEIGDVFRQEYDNRYRVGRTWVERDHAVPGRYTWFVDALDGDMAPSAVRVTFGQETGERQAFARLTSLSTAHGGVRVPAADVLDCEGTTMDSLSLSWSAPEHQYEGASLVRSDNTPGSWYIYTYGRNEALGRAWPHLPSQVSLADVGLADIEFRVNVFAESLAAGNRPWSWSTLNDELVVARTYIHPLVKPRPEPPPFDEGVYAVTNGNVHYTTCDEDPASALVDLSSNFFYIRRVDVSLFELEWCTSVASCRTNAALSRHGIAFDFGYDGKSVSETFITLPPDSGGLCRGSIHVTAQLSHESDGSLRIERRFLEVPPFLSESGQCTYGGAMADASPSDPCVAMDVTQGTYQVPL